MERQRLQNVVAVVTGSDSGIGQAIAMAMAREGADVTVTYHTDRAGAEETCAHVRAAGRRAVLVHLDQRRYDSVAAMFEQTRRELGIPTVLVNNAASAGSVKPVAELTPEEWDDVIRTDLYGPFYCCREFIRGLADTELGGTIINITSVHEEIPMPGGAAYDAAKGGLRNLTRTLALEVSDQNIRVNNLAPGMVLTPMNQSSLDDPEQQAEEVRHIPMKRAALPEDIAGVAVFLASHEANYIQGASLMVDGGLMLTNPLV